MKAHSKKIARFAADILKQRPVFLDTETSGIDQRAEVVELAILDTDGAPLLESLLKPLSPIPYLVQQVHGIDNDMVRDAPTFAELWDDIKAIIYHRPLVIYNSAFDLRLLAQSAQRRDIYPEQPPQVYCAMLMYAEFYAQWNEEHESYVWQRLEEAARQCGIELPRQLHRATADAELCRQVVLHMAGKCRG